MLLAITLIKYYIEKAGKTQTITLQSESCKPAVPALTQHIACSLFQRNSFSTESNIGYRFSINLPVLQNCQLKKSLFQVSTLERTSLRS